MSGTSTSSTAVSVRTAHLLLASTIVIGAFTLTMVKVALDDLSALNLATGRVVVSAAFFGVVMAFRRLRSTSHVTGRAQVETRRGVVEVQTLEEVAALLKRAARPLKVVADEVVVKVKPKTSASAISAKMAAAAAEIDDEEFLLMHA